MKFFLFRQAILRMGNQQSYACNAEDNVEVWEQTLVNTQSTFSDEGLQRLAQ